MSDSSLGAGARIRAARQQRGLPLDVLAAQMKVPVARLDALEREQWDALPDPTHARALATSVCRALELDARPILEAMPRGAGAALERVTQGLNQPFRTAPARTWSVGLWGLLALLLLAGAALLAWPHLQTLLPPTPSQPAAPAVLPAQDVGITPPTPIPAASPASDTAPAVPAEAASAAPVEPSVPAALEIRASRGASWVSVMDAQGATLAAQLLDLGETLTLPLPAALPVRVVLGNAPVVDLSWRGQAQALEGYEQSRVAKLELK